MAFPKTWGRLGLLLSQVEEGVQVAMVTETQTPSQHCIARGSVKAALFRVGQDRAGKWTKMPTFKKRGIV